MQDGCVGCKVATGALIPPGGLICQGTDWVVGHHLSPCPLRGWFVITARRHVEDVGELTTDEASELGVLVSKISAAVTDALRPARVHVFSHGEMVPHVHVHVLPRYDGMPPSGLEALLAIRNGEWRCSDQDAADTAAAVRAALA